MPTFTINFFTEADWASTKIEAGTPEQALQRAHEMERDEMWTLDFQSYDSTEGVERIEIWDRDRATVAEWQSPELCRRLAAHDLLAALEKAVTALNVVPRFPVPCLDTHSYAIAALCDAAIAKAKGRAP